MGNMVVSFEIIDFLAINILLVVGFLLYNVMFQRIFLKRRIKLGHYRSSLDKIKEMLSSENRQHKTR